jgi:hypothetical protein
MVIISIMEPLASQAQTHELLLALGEQLEALNDHIELVVIGGSALLAIGLITRSTRDVDVVGLWAEDGIVDPRPLPESLLAAAARVSRDFGLPAGWLNSTPASLLDFGLPAGFLHRLEAHEYGPGLTVHFAGRVDQIHFKLYAMADQGAGKHESDLRSLEPTRAELLEAARWTRTHDPSEGFREQLVAALEYLGVQNAAHEL